MMKKVTALYRRKKTMVIALPQPEKQKNSKADSKSKKSVEAVKVLSTRAAKMCNT